MSGIASDDKETSRVIAIHDGAREAGYGAALSDVARLIGELLRRKGVVCEASGEYAVGTIYAIACNDVLTGIQELQALRSASSTTPRRSRG